jgi:hypothetical protein
LVCPREHVTSANALTPLDAGLARRMLQAAGLHTLHFS